MSEVVLDGMLQELRVIDERLGSIESAINTTGIISAENSTTTPLAGDATYTGTWVDISDYAAISINAGADVNGTLYAEFSAAGSTGGDDHRTVQLSSGNTSAWGIHDLVRVAKYFRVKVVNGSAAQTSMNVQTILSRAPLIAMATSRAAQTINDYSDVQNTRILSDILLDEARGLHSNRKVVEKFGHNPAVANATEETIWGTDGLYTGFIQAASAVRIAAGGDAADSASGLGAQGVTIEGLDETWAEASETIACNANGTLASSSTSTTFIRVFRCYVSATGTYGGDNTGVMTIETTGGVAMASIEANKGQTEMAVYTVPLNKEAYIRRIDADVDSAKGADITFYQRQNADDVSTPFSPRRIIYEFSALAGPDAVSFSSYKGPFPAKTDLWVNAIGTTGSPAVSASFDLILVDV